MMIFNQGKYKSILAAESGELEQIAQQVAQDQDFRPVYHLAPPTGLLNDPNGLIFDGERYHIFYQWFPFDAMHGMKHWRHLITQDFVHFTSAENLVPDQLFESHGCYSGGALMQNDEIWAFYTGNTRRASDNQRVPFQNLARFSRDGKLLSKQALIQQAPQGYSEHVRDPKPWLAENGKIRFICGAQRENLSGTAIVFEMDNLQSPPRLLGELNLPAFDNRNVFMWECPDLLKIGEKDVFIWSPQGKAREAHQLQNNYHATYALGKLDNLHFQAQHIAELDQGFDFYAPQTFAGLDNRQQAIMLAWCGLPDLTYPTDKFKWHSMLTLPREITVQGDKLYQRPMAKIYQNITALENYHLENQAEIQNLDRAYVKFNANNQSFNLRFFDNAQGQHLSLSYDKNLLCLDRSFSEQTELMRSFGEQRYCEIDNLHTVEIFFDKSIVEIFLNNGEKTLTSRFFIANRKNQLQSNRPIQIEVGYPKAIEQL